METRTRKTSYQIPVLTLQAINQMLIRIGQRLDKLDGIGQNPDLHGRVITNVGAGVKETDAARKGDVEEVISQVSVLGGSSAKLRAGLGIELTETSIYTAVAVKQQGALTDVVATPTVEQLSTAVNAIHDRLRGSEIIET